MLLNDKGKRRTVYPHDMNVSFAMKMIMDRLRPFEKERTIKHIRITTGADHVEISDLSMHFESAHIKMFSYHLPVYVHSHNHDSMVINKFVDGYTGEYSGDYVLSSVKMFTVGGLLGIGTIPFFTIGTGLTLSSLIFRMFLGGLLTGIPTRMYESYIHTHKYHIDMAKTNEIEVSNKTSHVDNDDVKRRQNAEYFNRNLRTELEFRHHESERYKHKNLDSTVKEKLILLGLDPKILPTESELKDKYHAAIKKWHPDTYQGNERLAAKMTLRINDAYRVLLKVIKQQ